MVLTWYYCLRLSEIKKIFDPTRSHRYSVPMKNKNCVRRTKQDRQKENTYAFYGGCWNRFSFFNYAVELSRKADLSRECTAVASLLELLFKFNWNTQHFCNIYIMDNIYEKQKDPFSLTHLFLLWCWSLNPSGNMSHRIISLLPVSVRNSRGRSGCLQRRETGQDWLTQGTGNGIRSLSSTGHCSESSTGL